jgi:transcriptional regulator with XRE-family HTH domain
MAVTRTGPTLRQYQLAEELKDARESAGITRRRAAEHLRCSIEKIGHFERRRNVPSEHDLRALLDLYGCPDRFDELWELCQQAHERSPLAYRRLPSWLKLYLNLENEATDLYRFSLELVPGLLQSENYARELTRVHGLGSREADRHIVARMERKQRLESGDLRLSAVMSEAVLHITGHMGLAGTEQLWALLKASQLPSVELRVLPFAAGAHRSMDASFTVMAFSAVMMGPVGYYDHAGGGTFVEDEPAVNDLCKKYEYLAAQSLDPAATSAFIEEFIQRRTL